jgi:hypothetical protein
MTFEEYTELRQKPEHNTASEKDALDAFAASQPRRCPKCGCMVFDPYNWGIVLHDVVKCKLSRIVEISKTTTKQKKQ